MARIRTLKPEIWTDEKFGPLDPLTKLVFIGLISQADDGGRLLDSVRLIDGLLFAYDDSTSVRRSLDELSRTGLIQRGKTKSGQRVIQITKWEEHQKIDRPNLEAALPPIAAPDKEIQDFDEASTKARRKLDEGSSARSTTYDQRSTTDDHSDAAENGHMKSSELVAYWIDRCRAPPPPSERAKQGAAAKRICEKHTRDDVVRAAIGIQALYPHSNGEPWDIFDLERKFAKAHQAAENHPEVKERAFDAAFSALTEDGP